MNRAFGAGPIEILIVALLLQIKRGDLTANAAQILRGGKGIGLCLAQSRLVALQIALDQLQRLLLLFEIRSVPPGARFHFQ